MHIIKVMFSDNMLLPFCMALSVCSAYLLILIFKNKSCTLKEILFRKQVLRLITLFVSVMYFLILIETTLINRIGLSYKPFDHLFSDWSVFETEFTWFVNFNPISNVLMFIPFSFIIYLIKRFFFANVYDNKKLLYLSVFLSFLCSLSIEVTQIITKLGAFQLSDLVYNTLGGLIGALIFIAARKIINKKRTRD